MTVDLPQRKILRFLPSLFSSSSSPRSTPLNTISSSPRLIQVSLLARSFLLSDIPSILYMQPEPTAVSQHTSSDSPQADSHPTQHGNDYEDGPVSGPLSREANRGSTVPGASTPGASSPPLSPNGLTPSPAQRVSQHESAVTSGKKAPELGFQVISSGGQSRLPLETLPNGMCCDEHPRNLAPLTAKCRGSHPHLVAPASAVTFGYNIGISSIP